MVHREAFRSPSLPADPHLASDLISRYCILLQYYTPSPSAPLPWHKRGGDRGFRGLKHACVSPSFNFPCFRGNWTHPSHRCSSFTLGHFARGLLRAGILCTGCRSSAVLIAFSLPPNQQALVEAIFFMTLRLVTLVISTHSGELIVHCREHF